MYFTYFDLRVGRGAGPVKDRMPVSSWDYIFGSCGKNVPWFTMDGPRSAVQWYTHYQLHTRKCMWYLSITYISKYIYIESRFMLEIWSWFFVIFGVIFHVSIIFTVKTSEIVWHLCFDYYLKCMVPKFQTCWVNWNLYSHVGAVRFTIFHSQPSYYM